MKKIKLFFSALCLIFGLIGIILLIVSIIKEEKSNTLLYIILGCSVVSNIAALLRIQSDRKKIN